ncbi:hypothetical protein Rsub_02706 [Raphidocelis subcapitata]|uniref:DUF760 domain-containing protein n=1 Tax=Raphidocelis subcapitata TaxID=307507 RepID=A0A2V0NWQ3_9CHLO|nr:hypothetical protein Rsub_02706 [Raphidocelis subcapitata]|eukprot:GBF90000.1 hypothetical protein Rsub_02706 [Raphidocelis subcapitata]
MAGAQARPRLLAARVHRPALRSGRTPLLVRAEAGGRPEGSEFGLAPAKPKTPYGEMLQYYLKMQPQLFKAAVEQQLQRLKEERDAREAPPALPAPDAGAGAAPPAAARHPEVPEGDADAAAAAAAAGGGEGGAEMVLYQRMQEVRAREVRATLEDLIYVSILEKFVGLGVEMLPRLDGFVDPGPANLVALTEGVHSREALELVREHLLGVMGPAAGRQFSSELVKMSKFQIAQVYAASVMFGYFLRRVDRRFQLEKALGGAAADAADAGAITAGEAVGIAEPAPGAGAGPAADDAVARLEALFQRAGDVETASDPDTPSDASVYEVGGGDDEADSAAAADAAAARRGSGAGASGSGADAPPPPGALLPVKSALRRYVESFDQATMVDTARVVSAEGAALVERQTAALFGDIKELTRQMQDAVGGGVGSAEELYARIQAAVAGNKIETVTMSVATQRRCVLEAVAFGSFLRDVEGHVGNEYGLLTPLPAPKNLM